MPIDFYYFFEKCLHLGDDNTIMFRDMKLQSSSAR